MLPACLPLQPLLLHHWPISCPFYTFVKSLVFLYVLCYFREHALTLAFLLLANLCAT